MSISDYAPAFGEEELLSVQAQLPRITGRVPVGVGPTGVYGRMFADAGRRQAAQAVAAGDVASLARSRKRKAMADAAIQLGRDKRAADEATFQQQARTRGNIAAAFGEGIESTRGVIENPMFQFAMKGARERAEQARAQGAINRAEVRATQDDIADWSRRRRGIDQLGAGDLYNGILSDFERVT